MNVGNTQTMIDRTVSFQPMFVYGGGSSTQHPISIMNGVPQDTMLNSMSEACIQGTFNEVIACPPQPMYRNVNQPLLTGTQDIQFQPTTDGRTIQQALYSAIPRIEPQPKSYATNMNYPRSTYMPSILGTEAPIVSEMQTQSSSVHDREENSLMLITILQRIQILETQLNNIKTSITASVERKLDEVNLCQNRIVDNTPTKTYSAAVQQQQQQQQQQNNIETSNVDEGYFNNSINITVRDSSQTPLKTTYQHAAATTPIKRPTPRRIPVRVTDRVENRDEHVRSNENKNKQYSSDEKNDHRRFNVELC